MKVSYGAALEELSQERLKNSSEIHFIKTVSANLENERNELRTMLQKTESMPARQVPKLDISSKAMQTEELKEFIPPRPIDSPRDSVSGLVDKLSRMEGKCESYRADILALTQELKAVKDENERLQVLAKQLEKYRDQFREMQETRDSVTKELRKITQETVPANKHGQLELELKNALAKAKSAEDKFRDIISKLSQSEAENRDLSTKVDQLQASIAAIQLTRKELQGEVSRLKDLLSDREGELSYEQSRYNQNQKHMNFELEKCQLEIARLKDQQVDRESSSMKIQELERQIKMLRLHKEENAVEKNDMIRKIDQLESMVSDLEIELSNQELIKESNRAVNEKLALTEAKYTQAMASLSLISHDKAYLKQQEAVALDSKDLLRAQVDDLEKEKVQSRALIDSLRHDILERDRQINKLSSGYTTSESQLAYYTSHFTKASSELQLLRGKTAELESSIEVKDAIILKQTEGVKAATADIKALQAKINELEDTIRHLKETLDSKEDQLKALEAQNGELYQDAKKSVAFLTQSQGKIKELSAKNKELAAQVKQGMETIQTGQEEIDKLKEIREKSALNEQQLKKVSEDMKVTKEHLEKLFAMVETLPEAEPGNREGEAAESQARETAALRDQLVQVKRSVAESINLVSKLTKSSSQTSEDKAN